MSLHGSRDLTVSMMWWNSSELDGMSRGTMMEEAGYECKSMYIWVYIYLQERRLKGGVRP